MVLEKLVSLRTAVRNPWSMFLVGGSVSVTCLLLSSMIFKTNIGLFTSFFVTFAMTPLMLDLIRYEEVRGEEMIKRRKGNLLQRHKGILKIYTAFFAGMILSLSIIYTMLPERIVQTIFEDQIKEIGMIRGLAAFGGTFQRIVTNNVGVLLLSFLLSFLLGAGAIFILAWNASVLATAVGMAAKSIGGVRGLPMALLMFFPHGSLEILAYFLGGIAGGLISVAVTRKKSVWFWFVVRDSIMLVLISVWLLAVAGIIETLSIVL